LAAISQNYARKYKISIDSLVFKYEIQNDLVEDIDMNIDILFENNPKYKIIDEDGLLICGMYMDGGIWDREKKIILDSAQRFAPLPHLLCKLIKVNKII
jgi:dynein heavy chain